MKVIIVKGSQLHKNVHDCYDMIVNEYKKAIKRDPSIQKKVQQSLKNKEGG